MRIVRSAVLLVFICLSLNGAVAGADTSLPATYQMVMENGDLIPSDVDPYYHNGILVFPVRAVAEALGMSFQYKPEDAAIHLVGPSWTTVLTVGSNQAEWNGKPVRLLTQVSDNGSHWFIASSDLYLLGGLVYTDPKEERATIVKVAVYPDQQKVGESALRMCRLGLLKCE